MYVTSRGAPRTGLPFVLPVSFDKIDNNNNNNSRARYCTRFTVVNGQVVRNVTDRFNTDKMTIIHQA